MLEGLTELTRRLEDCRAEDREEAVYKENCLCLQSEASVRNKNPVYEVRANCLQSYAMRGLFCERPLFAVACGQFSASVLQEAVVFCEIPVCSLRGQCLLSETSVVLEARV